MKEPMLRVCKAGHYSVRENARVRCHTVYCASSGNQVTSLGPVPGGIRVCRERVKPVGDEALLSVWRLGGINALIALREEKKL